MKKILILLAVVVTVGCSVESKRGIQSLPDFDALWNYDDPKQTEMKFRELIPTAIESGDTSYYV